MKSKILFLLLFSFGILSLVQAQNWKSWKDSVKVTGGVNASVTYYRSFRVDSQQNTSREPFFWMVSARLSFQYRSFSLPFSVSINRERSNFTHPFHMPSKRVGISPEYKGITLHLGYRSMTFSEFTLAGNSFLGTGLEVKRPESPIQLKVMFGRFAEAYEGDTAQYVSPELPLFRRFGWGNQLSYERKGNHYSISIFKAWDVRESLTEEQVAFLQAKPMENLVAGFNFRHQLAKPWQLEGEYAFSALTRDTRKEEADLDKFSYLNNLGKIFTPRISSGYHSAYWFRLNYTFQQGRAFVKLRRISPDYRTLGAVFLSNDLQDISSGLSLNLFENTLNLGFNAGIQHTDLEADQSNRRFIGGVNVSTKLWKKIPFTVNFSNFNARNFQTRFQTEDPSAIQDSIYYLQVTHKASFTLGYASGETLKQNTSLSFSYQDTYSGQEGQENAASFYNLNVSQQWNLPKQFRLTGSLSLSRQYANEQLRLLLMPVLKVGKSLFKNSWKNSVSLIFQTSYFEGENEQLLFKCLWTSSYQLLKKQRLSLTLSFLDKSRKDARALRELQTQLSYQYAF